MKYVAVFLLSVMLMGYTSNSSSAAVKSQTHSVSSVQSHAKEVFLETSLYQSITKFKKTVSQSKIIWKGKDITLTANKIKLDHVATFEQNVITTMVITNGSKKYTIPFDESDERPLDISSVSLAPSHTFLAVHVNHSAGYYLLLVDLKTGKSTMLNDRLKAEGKGFIETISAYNWSPKENKIAFAYGDTSKKSIAIYNVNNDTFFYLPRETNYISTALVLWHKNGEILDFICEYPSDQWKLYRYSTNSKKVKTIKSINREELSKLFPVIVANPPFASRTSNKHL
ncbi:hypothetical protein [Paenibacillus sp. IHBB 10380]|uniref:hypothetical protein n=1 Tax=Paenibacillus sp. IHBB 10380 TaxID=1566358 RepID=UPI0005CF9D4F|nr:hypothetical protein [Paenibacillus sp. IHBB 10380]